MTQDLFPAAIADLTPAVLTEALRGTATIAPEVTVTDFRTERIAEGVGFASVLHRVFLELDGEGPATLVLKVPTENQAYLDLALMIKLYDREVYFYADVATAAPIRTPRAHVAKIKPGTTDFLVLMDDLADLDNADHIEGLSLERTQVVIDELARFHAWGWGLEPEAARRAEFLPLDDPRMVGLFAAGAAGGWPIYQANARMHAPDGLAELIEDFAAKLPVLLSALAQPVTLLNGDLRADNLFFDEAGRLTTVDFQLVGRGAGVWDVAYLVGQGMTPQERGAREQELVRRYTDGLAAAGVDYPFEQAWDQFRVALVAQIALPLLAMLSWDTLNDRGRKLLHALMERAFTVIADTDALSVVPR